MAPDLHFVSRLVFQVNSQAKMKEWLRKIGSHARLAQEAGRVMPHRFWVCFGVGGRGRWRIKSVPGTLLPGFIANGALIVSWCLNILEIKWPYFPQITFISYGFIVIRICVSQYGFQHACKHLLMCQ